jgi:hypothetical protein
MVELIGLSQLKWLWFQEPQVLIALEEFDRASRGPLGAMALMFQRRKQYVERPLYYTDNSNKALKLPCYFGGISCRYHSRDRPILAANYPILYLYADSPGTRSTNSSDQ